MLSLTLDELKTIILSEYCNLALCSLTAGQITGLLHLYLQHLWMRHCSNMILNTVDKLAGLSRHEALWYVARPCQIL